MALAFPWPAQVPLDRPEPTDSAPTLSVVICAYNEERNLPALLDAVLAASGDHFRLEQVLLVASGCSDRTVEIGNVYSRRDRRVEVIAQAHRAGKASALGLGLGRARGDLVIVQNADTLPGPGAYEALTRPFEDPVVTLTCPRVVPVAVESSIASAMAETVWDVHHYVSTIEPKAGEAFALRRPPPVPEDIEDDDTYVGVTVARGEGSSRYVPEAVVFNRAPSVLGDLLRQRFRVNRHIVGLYRHTGILTSTWTARTIVRAVGRCLKAEPRRLPSALLMGMLEAYVRALAILSATFARRPLTTWRPIESTKAAVRVPDRFVQH